MESLAFVLIGTLFLGYSIILCRKLIHELIWDYLRKPWRALYYILLVFFGGYVSYLYVLLFSQTIYYAEIDIIISAILLLGSFFVYLFIGAGYNLFDELKSTEKEVSVGRIALDHDQGAFERQKKDIERKQEELEVLLEELYTLRLKMEKGSKAGKLSKRQIKNRLDKVKKEL